MSLSDYLNQDVLVTLMDEDLLYGTLEEIDSSLDLIHVTYNSTGKYVPLKSVKTIEPKTV